MFSTMRLATFLPTICVFSVFVSHDSIALQQTVFPNQPAAASQQTTASAATPAVSVDLTQPVITVHGICDEGPRKSPQSACGRVITRKEFESLMEALNPGGQSISQSGKQNLAQAYVEALAFAEAARKAGTEQSAQFREVMYWLRLRTIADLYRRSLQEEYRSPASEEIDAYYQQHLLSFEKVRLQRILVPRENLSASDKAEFDKRALGAAQGARARATKGDDLELIQREVYAALGLDRPPGTDLGSFRRADLMEKEAAEVFSLQPGEVSQVQTELRSYVIYKVMGKETPTQAQVKAEILRELPLQKYRAALKAVLDSAPAEFNEQYFGPMAPKLPLESPLSPRPAR